MKAYIQATKARFASYAKVVVQEAIELLRRRKYSYAVLALTLTAGSLYFSGVRPAFATNGPTSGWSADDRSATPSQSLQAVTGQHAGQSDGGTPPQDDAAAGQQSHTSVTINGTDIPVPANGEVHKTMTDGGSTTSISVSHDSSSDNSYSSLNVQVSSQSTASEEGD